ncbi:hypothetical protein [Pandoraea terrigena]|uniref:Uncharacterized protein n=1 Tax=Pandoraea terrigena TaxID=2508292 RepID=A0A5E4YV82_9BURK|nr:hypothetical protein [Pandoraea terrigena]VVE52789.1 hypothetical protein PTE31013_04840 [Pandoraea terrigena]
MDHFRPTREPARSIYDTLLSEASKRKGRRTEDWISAERDAVLREAIFLAQKMGRRAPSLEDVERAERAAMGHSDYIAKWSYGVAAAITS